MEYAGESKTGLVRSVNQDRILLLSHQELLLFVVADGMGGHSDGERASQAIIDRLQEWWQVIDKGQEIEDFFKLVEAIKREIEQVNWLLYNTYKDRDICGSTVSILLIYKQQYAIFHVGDSRIYKLEKRTLTQITIDEVWENDIRTRKKFSAYEIDRSHKRGKLINAIGTAPQLMMTIKTDCLKEDMVFFLCSDGFYKMVKQRYLCKILKALRKGFPLQWGIGQLMSKVYQSGAKDNVSIIIVRASKMSRQ